MRRKQLSVSLILASVLYLGGCTFFSTIPTLPIRVIAPTGLKPPTKVFAEPSVTTTHLIPTVIPAPIEPSITGTPALPPLEVLVYDPYKIAPDLSNLERPKDALMIGTDVLHFDPIIRTEALVLSEKGSGCFSPSPDGKWLAYCLLSRDSPTGQWLIVKSYDLKQQKKVPMDLGLTSFESYEWLDSQRLIFPLIRRGNVFLPRPDPMVVINPFTGSPTQLSSNYPGLTLLDIDPCRMIFNYSDVVYDPSLNYVIFPEAVGQGYYVLWDRQKHVVLAKVEDQNGLGHYPLWSPDGKQLAVAVEQNQDQFKFILDEWFQASLEGRVEQLTHFGNYFTRAEIGAANWSPDGQKLAFWLKTDPELCTGYNLAILEMQTQQVIGTCVPGSDQGSPPPPVWSLDSRYIAVINYGKNTSRAILVDTEKGSAYQIPGIDSAMPEGWLVEAP
jgi:hypothetical protein